MTALRRPRIGHELETILHFIPLRYITLRNCNNMARRSQNSAYQVSSSAPSWFRWAFSGKWPMHRCYYNVLTPKRSCRYGWSAQEHNHWIVPILGSTFVAFGMMTVLYVVHCVFMCTSPNKLTIIRALGWALSLCIQLYLVDTFAFAASALSAAAVRSISSKYVLEESALTTQRGLRYR